MNTTPHSSRREYLVVCRTCAGDALGHGRLGVPQPPSLESVAHCDNCGWLFADSNDPKIVWSSEPEARARLLKILSREEIDAILDSAPPPRDPTRLDYIGSKAGSLWGWMTRPDMDYLGDWLPALARTYKRPMRMVEVGTFGGSTARGLIVLSRGGLITCIDDFSAMNPGTLGGHPDGRTFWKRTLTSSPSLWQYAMLKIGPSVDMASTLEGAYDLILVDACHDAPHPMQDIQAYAPHVAIGGYLLVDDYDMKDVRAACDAFFVGDAWRIIRTPTDGGKVLIAQKLRIR